MKWIETTLKYRILTLILPLEQKKARFNVKYEIVLHTPVFNALCVGWSDSAQGGASTSNLIVF